MSGGNGEGGLKFPGSEAWIWMHQVGQCVRAVVRIYHSSDQRHLLKLGLVHDAEELGPG